VKAWTVADVYELAQAIVGAGDSFYTRRLLQRLERGELSMVEAAARLRCASTGPRVFHAQKCHLVD